MLFSNAVNVAYYAIDSYPLFHIMLYKKSNEIHHTTKFTVLVQRPFNTTVQQNTKDVALFLLHVRESDSPSL